MLILSALAVAIVIVIIIAVAVVEVKNGNYTLVDQCMVPLASVTASTNTGSSFWDFILR